MLYKFEIEMTDNDYYECNKYHLTDSPDVKKSMILGKLIIPAIFLMDIIYNIIQCFDWFSLTFYLVFYGVISVIWFLTYKPFTLLFFKMQMKFMKKCGKMPYDKHSEMEFYDNYFVEKTENTKEEIQYNAIFKVRVNEPKAIYIYKNVVTAYIVPFSSFNSDDERNKFINFISEKTSK